jgi:pilus assembly protein CpaC
MGGNYMQIRHDGVKRNGQGGHGLGIVGWLIALVLVLGVPQQVAAQRVLTQPTRTITLARGASALVQTAAEIARFSVADPEIANATVVSNREVLVDARTPGTTTLLIWDRQERVELISIVITPDIGPIQRQIEMLFPNVPVTLSAAGNAIIVSGTIRDPSEARRILEVIRSTSGVTVIDNITSPAARQILLHVRFAEVSRTALSRLSADLFTRNPQDLGDAIDDPATFEIETLAEGIVRMFLSGANGAQLETIIRALKTNGHFRSLAEPNLIALEGQPATFLAGGEFPFPVVQQGAGGGQGTITIQWKEFGVRLNFTPFVTNIGTIRLTVSPEVSSLDFANGLTFGGFQIPAILTRRAETSIELRPGQHIAIAGLLDNSTLTEWQKIPLLGDLPILGTLFRSRSVRDRNTELLVIVTPHLVEPVDVPPAVPTGEIETWDRTRFMRERSLDLPAGVRIVPPAPPAGN